ncbi:hypothetical protein WL21_32495 [Burkholderia ubonensis]|uniref:hypothetical protein n=1 Tax=Burkholderia ubonensis TaxID=101571 RepID=UPI00075C9E48|nr:hypothetical protein [Burkholderia ubonensis]KVO95554.1 hypothetical protein WJ81_02775 [Burkholderia ubonensis]KVZ58477.1 hypothetical protein WL20_22425 [Burkholderia ubonensis]KVZ75130.1 hypothetical protein WL21_32495 [Burkholderia ubonensis]
MNQSEFAALHGVSRKTVTKWKERGWLVFAGDAIDVKASNANLIRYRRDGAPAVTQPMKKTAKGNRRQSVTQAAKGVTLEDGESVSEVAGRILSGNVELLTFDDARCLKENYLGLMAQLEYERKSGSLVELDTATAILFEEFRAQRDAWLNWPTRVGPILAADLGVEADRVVETLTAHVHKHIAQLGEPEANFSEREG